MYVPWQDGVLSVFRIRTELHANIYLPSNTRKNSFSTSSRCGTVKMLFSLTVHCQIHVCDDLTVLLEQLQTLSVISRFLLEGGANVICHNLKGGGRQKPPRNKPWKQLHVWLVQTQVIRTLNPGLEITIKKQLQKIGEGSRDGNAKKYSSKGGRDDNKYNRHPYIIHTCTRASHNTVLSLVELLWVCT